MAHLKLIVACLLVAIFMQTEAFLGFSKTKSLIFREPPVDDNNGRSDDVTEHWITQKLDNFDPTDTRTFHMRYLQNKRYFKSGGPIFLVAGGEWEISPGHILPGQHIVDLAKEFDALLLYSEHRYYGKTKPTNSTSTADLRYLSVDQALADLAHFITSIKSDIKLNATGGVIAVGGSYGGTMVTWFRQKYPHIVTGAWASSAPLHAKIDFIEYKETTGDSIRNVGGEECYQKVEDTFSAIEDLFASGDIARLRELFNMCDDFDATDQFDVSNFHSELSDIFAGVVQYHRPGQIEGACKKILAENTNGSDIETDDLYSFARFIRDQVETSGKCNSFSFNKTIEVLSNTNWDGAASRSSMRQWIYQTCSEFGWYQTSGSENQPFGSSFPVDLYLRMCTNAYGNVFTNATMTDYISRKNSFYGSLQPDVTRVFITHGTVDPWHRMGILSTLNPQTPVAIIPGASHCNDLKAINWKNDTREMLFVKVTIRNLVKSWLNL